MNQVTAQYIVDQLRGRFGLDKSWAAFDASNTGYVVFVPTASGAPGAQLQTLADAERLIHGLEAQHGR